MGRDSVDSTLRRILRWSAAGALLVLAPSLSRGADQVLLDEAYTMRQKCITAKAALQKTQDLAGLRDAAYWTALRAGEADVMSAYQLSVSANWPSSLYSTRETVHASLVKCIWKLSKLDRPDHTFTTAGIRDDLDVEIARMNSTSQVLQGIAPSNPPASAPVLSPAPAGSSAPVVGAIADLVPGTGFTGATAQPAAIGSGAGSDAKAIARWDVVPYQTVTGKLPVGVVAFHMSGIDRVEFSVNGGAWKAVSAMTLNPVSGVWEYNVNVDAATLADGAAEVRAVVYPKVGTPRVLAGAHDAANASLVSGEYSLFLTANSHGTVASPVRWVSPTGSDSTGDGTQSKPFKTILWAVDDVHVKSGTADNAVIYLSEGDYAYPNMGTPAPTSSRWLTLSAAPGTTNDKVRLVSSNGSLGLNTKLVHLKSLTLKGVELPDNGANYDRVWAENCAMEGSGPLDATRFFPLGSWTGGVFVTESTIKNVKYPVYGQMLTRNTLVTDVGGDAFREPSGLVVNCEVKNLVTLDDTHNDVVQFWDPSPRAGFENIIFYGLKAVKNINAQALFVQQYGSAVSSDNFAFVNYLTYATIGAQWQNPGKHVLVWNSEFLSPPEALSTNKGGFMLLDVTTGSRATSVHNLSVKNSVFQRFNALQTGAEPSTTSTTSWADNNHYIDVTSYTAIAPGANATTGGSLSNLVVDPANENFAPMTNSPLVNRVQTLLTPADVAGRARKSPDAIGAVGATQ